MKYLLPLLGTLSFAVSIDAAVDFSKIVGPVKPVNGINQPPMIGMPLAAPMFHYLTEAGIPYSRVHDISGWFGGSIYADIPAIFKNFDADENDPANYSFSFTDSLITKMFEHGLTPFFRLGVTIENFVQWGFPAQHIAPPKDFAKWARICEHIIRHYTEGWADGFRYPIVYWEVWNEPDNNPDPKINPQWTASFEEYIRFYGVVAPYLKKCFPKCKIGGYGSCGFYAAAKSERVFAANSSSQLQYFVDCSHKFLAAVRDNGWPLDFFSFHSYSNPKDALAQVRCADEHLTSYGFTRDRTERIFNEWLPFVKFRGTARQAAGVAAELIGLQNGPCDLACVYDGRCSTGNYAAIFSADTQRPRKAYWSFYGFNELRKLGKAVELPPTPEGIYAAAATDGAGHAAVLMANIGEEPWTCDFDFGDYRLVYSAVVDADTDYGVRPFDGKLPPETVRMLYLEKSAK